MLNQVDPQHDFKERMERAREFVAIDQPQHPFIVAVDGWDNNIDNILHLWPDLFYLVDNNWRIIQKASYTHIRGDGVVDEDYLDVLERLLQ